MTTSTHPTDQPAGRSEGTTTPPRPAEILPAPATPITRRELLIAAGVFVLLALLFTSPVLFRLNSAVFGPQPGDSLFQIWAGWWRAYTLTTGDTFRQMTLSQAPFGTEYINRWPFLGTSLAMGLLAVPFGEVAAYNLLIIGAFVFSGFLAYLLARHLIDRPAPALLAGVIFAYAPMAVQHSFDYVDLSQQWVLPLFLLALLWVTRRPEPLSAVALGAAFALPLYLHPYYAYYNAIAAVVFAAVLGIWARGRLPWGWYALGAVVGGVLCLPEGVNIIADLRGANLGPLRTENTLIRGDEWYLWLSARPWDFVLPPPDHPVLGGLSRSAYGAIREIGRLDFAPPFIEQRFPGINGRWFWQSSIWDNNASLYLGLANLAAAGVALFHRWKTPTVVLFAALFVVNIAFSLPPYLPVGAVLRPLGEAWHNVVLPTPALLTMSVAQPLRVSARFVVPAMLALAMLAALGLDALLTGAPQQRAPVILGVFGAVLLFEYAIVPQATPLPEREEIAWLAQQTPGTIVAGYPFGDRLWLTYQRIHEQPTVASLAGDSNLLLDNLGELERHLLSDIERPQLAPRLAALGTAYAINSGPPLDAAPAGMELVLETETGQVFAVTAPPADLAVLHTPFNGLWLSDSAWAWDGPQHPIVVWNPLNEAVPITLTLTTDGPGPELQVVRRLTPPPDRVFRSGILVPNPNIPPPYPAEPVSAVRTEAGYTIEGLTMQPGETIIILRWAGEGSPAVSAVTVAVRAE